LAILVLDDKVEIDASGLALRHIDVGGLEFLEVRLYLYLLHLSTDNLWLHHLLVGAYSELKFLTDIPEENLLLQYLAPLLHVLDLALLHNHYAERAEHLKLVCLGVIRGPAVAVQAEVVVRVTREALEAVRPDRLHQTLIASHVLMLIALQLELSIYLLDDLTLGLYFLSQDLLIGS
jgi:hypothetical protein